MTEPSSELRSYMRKQRRYFHRFPEVGLDLPNTHNYIAQELRSVGLEVEQHPSGGVTTTIAGINPDARNVILRADMDALPVVEETGEEFTSENTGAAHACGHDLHMATMLGVARDLVTNPPVRPVVVVFQPGEETDRGAVPTLKHDNLQVTDADAYAVHVNSSLPRGTVHYRRGTFMAFGDWFTIEINGIGGHASAPERVGSPIRLGGSFVESFVSLAKKLSRDDDKAVSTVTEFISGNTVNVIPASGRLRGTIRSTQADVRSELIAGMQEIVGSQHRDMRTSLSIKEGYPAVVSDDAALEFLVGLLSQGPLANSLHQMAEPSMVIEDFSYFLQKWPGAMVYVGAQAEENPAFNHSANARFHDDAMDTSFTLFRALVDNDRAVGG